jgi:hypothetical protein
MNYNISIISSINQSYIHLNDNGTQERITTKIQDIKEIKTLIEIELNHLNYMIREFEIELILYDEKIEKVNAIINNLDIIIQKGMNDNIPKHKRSLSNEHFEFDNQVFLLKELNSNRRGICIMLIKAQNKLNHYKELLKQCDIILRG